MAIEGKPKKVGQNLPDILPKLFTSSQTLLDSPYSTELPDLKQLVKAGSEGKDYDREGDISNIDTMVKIAETLAKRRIQNQIPSSEIIK